MKRLTLFLLLTALVLSCSKNTPPVIESLFCVPDSVQPGESVELQCAATDMDGDELIFQWYFQDIQLTSWVWLAPDDPGDYYVKIRVSDQIDIVEDSLLVKVRGPGRFIDTRDGKAYRYVTIGSQVWMAENLAYLPVLTMTPNGSSTSPVYYVYGYKGTDIRVAHAKDLYFTYGALYNWEAARISCPTGWHLPTDGEWKILEKYLGMRDQELDGTDWRLSGSVGDQLKESGTNHWHGPSNSTGFTALPGGMMAYNMGYTGFMDIGGAAYFWSATPYLKIGAWIRFLASGYPGMDRHYIGRPDGLSVRCVKDE